jgi:hypothetical protein
VPAIGYDVISKMFYRKKISLAITTLNFANKHLTIFKTATPYTYLTDQWRHSMLLYGNNGAFKKYFDEVNPSAC